MWAAALALPLLSMAIPAEARPSFSGDDTIDNVTITVGGVQKTFTIIRDAQRAGQYHYVPNEPQMFERIVNGVREPEFTLVRYQAPDPANPEQFIEAGLMQFAVRLALAPEEEAALEKALEAKLGRSEGPISLSALRLKSARVSLYNTEGDLIGKNAKAPSLAPTFASQKVAFEVPLTRLGADVYEALVNGNSGIYVSFAMKFEGLTPPVGVSCQMNWEKIHELYTKDQTFAAKASYLGLVSAGANVDKTEIRQKLETEQAVKCKGIGDENFDPDKMADKLINHVNSKLIKDFNPPDKIEVPQAEKAKFKGGKLSPKKLFGFGGSASYGVAIQDLKDVRSVSATYDMSFQTVEVRDTTVSGFVGIGKYPKAIRDKAVIEVNSKDWAKALFGLPSVSAETGVTRVDYQVQLNTSPPQSQVAVWEPGKDWTDLQGRARNSLAFGLLGLAEAERKDLEFTETIQLSLPRDVITINSVRDAVSEVNGTPLPIANALQPVDVVTVYPDSLSFGQLVPGSGLASVRVKLTSGGRTFNETIRPARINGAFQPPQPLVWFVERGAPISAEIEFVRSDRRETVIYEGREVNLRASPSLDVELFDYHWQGE